MTLRLACLLLVLLVPAAGPAAQDRGQKPPAVPGPMLDEGLMTVETPEFTLGLVRSSQTVAALKPRGAVGLDFTPGDLLAARSQNGYYHRGDRWREAGSAFRVEEPHS